MCLWLRSKSPQSSSVHMVKLDVNRSGQRQAATQLPVPPVLPVRALKIREVPDTEFFTVKTKNNNSKNSAPQRSKSQL